MSFLIDKVKGFLAEDPPNPISLPVETSPPSSGNYPTTISGPFPERIEEHEWRYLLLLQVHH
jgi:hypothetical protein